MGKILSLHQARSAASQTLSPIPKGFTKGELSELFDIRSAHGEISKDYVLSNDPQKGNVFVAFLVEAGSTEDVCAVLKYQDPQNGQNMYVVSGDHTTSLNSTDFQDVKLHIQQAFQQLATKKNRAKSVARKRASFRLI
jgi:hypothetical protein